MTTGSPTAGSPSKVVITARRRLVVALGRVRIDGPDTSSRWASPWISQPPSVFSHVLGVTGSYSSSISPTISRRVLDGDDAGEARIRR